MADKVLLIFDCDGTLVDSEGIANEIFIEAIHQLGIPLTEEEAWRYFPGTSMAICIKYVEDKYQTTLPTDFVARQREKQRIEFRKRLTPIPGVKSTLQKLPHEKCVASNGPMDVIVDNLRNTGLTGFFKDRIFSAYALNVWKPDPSLFLHAAEDLGYRADQCIVIEDSAAGIEAGINAQMKVLAYQPEHSKYDFGNFDDVTTFDDMTRLPEIISMI